MCAFRRAYIPHHVQLVNYPRGNLVSQVIIQPKNENKMLHEKIKCKQDKLGANWHFSDLNVTCSTLISFLEWYRI